MNPTASNYNSNANVNSFNGGALDNNIGRFLFIFYNNQYLIFDSYDNCLIKSCYIEKLIYNFELRNSIGTLSMIQLYMYHVCKQNIILNFDVLLKLIYNLLTVLIQALQITQSMLPL